MSWKSIVMLSIAVLTAACGDDSQTSTPPLPDRAEGFLSGQVTIGPLCPVEPCPSPVVDPYSSRALVITSEAPISEVTVPLRQDGSFSAVVPALTYEVNLTDCDFLGCSQALPIIVIVEPGETTTITIDIDTGIRTPQRS